MSTLAKIDAWMEDHTTQVNAGLIVLLVIDIVVTVLF